MKKFYKKNKKEIAFGIKLIIIFMLSLIATVIEKNI